jgi:hypothetical protein
MAWILGLVRMLKRYSATSLICLVRVELSTTYTMPRAPSVGRNVNKGIHCAFDLLKSWKRYGRVYENPRIVVKNIHVNLIEKIRKFFGTEEILQTVTPHFL